MLDLPPFPPAPEPSLEACAAPFACDRIRASRLPGRTCAARYAVAMARRDDVGCIACYGCDAGRVRCETLRAGLPPPARSLTAWASKRSAVGAVARKAEAVALKARIEARKAARRPTRPKLATWPRKATLAPADVTICGQRAPSPETVAAVQDAGDAAFRLLARETASPAVRGRSEVERRTGRPPAWPWGALPLGLLDDEDIAWWLGVPVLTVTRARKRRNIRRAPRGRVR